MRTTFEQLAKVAELFPLFILFLPDPLQSLRQVLDVRAEMLDGLQTVLKVTILFKAKNHNQSNRSAEQSKLSLSYKNRVLKNKTLMYKNGNGIFLARIFAREKP